MKFRNLSCQCCSIIYFPIEFYLNLFLPLNAFKKQLQTGNKLSGCIAEPKGAFAWHKPEIKTKHVTNNIFFI